MIAWGGNYPVIRAGELREIFSVQVVADTLGLSPILTEEMAKIIPAINGRGASFILAEQNARLALTLGHRGYVMETRRIALEGLTEDLVRDEGVKRAYLGL